MLLKKNKKFEYKVCVIGMGYVGIPLFLQSIKYFPTLGYDINKNNIKYLKEQYKNYNSYLTSNLKKINQSNFFIICVPTPIDKKNKPDLTILKNASKFVAENMKKNSVVVYESTVFPGCTEEICLPILEKYSNLKLNKDFYLGYSPERINPGDNKHTLRNIIKIVSASHRTGLKIINSFYKKIVDKSKTYQCETIKIAEASKVIENTQRDLNIAFVNELAIIFKNMNLDIGKILKAANTKWNFLDFKPGLVGGHCIGVDPYYLTYQSNKKGYNPKFILSGRDINQNMYKAVCDDIKKIASKKNIKLIDSRILIFGLTFKDNSDDVRNSQILDIANYYAKKRNKIHIFEPMIKKTNVKFISKYIQLKNKLSNSKYDLIIIARNHNIFKKIKFENIKKMQKRISILYDISGLFNNSLSDGHL